MRKRKTKKLSNKALRKDDVCDFEKGSFSRKIKYNNLEEEILERDENSVMTNLSKTELILHSCDQTLNEFRKNLYSSIDILELLKDIFGKSNLFVPRYRIKKITREKYMEMLEIILDCEKDYNNNNKENSFHKAISELIKKIKTKNDQEFDLIEEKTDSLNTEDNKFLPFISFKILKFQFSSLNEDLDFHKFFRSNTKKFFYIYDFLIKDPKLKAEFEKLSNSVNNEDYIESFMAFIKMLYSNFQKQIILIFLNFDYYPNKLLKKHYSVELKHSLFDQIMQFNQTIKKF